MRTATNHSPVSVANAAMHAEAVGSSEFTTRAAARRPTAQQLGELLRQAHIDVNPCRHIQIEQSWQPE